MNRKRPSSFGLSINRSVRQHIERRLNPAESELLYKCLSSFSRLLPHVHLNTWKVSSKHERASVTWTSGSNQFIDLVVRFKDVKLTSFIAREVPPNTRERDLFQSLQELNSDEFRIAASIVRNIRITGDSISNRASIAHRILGQTFDESVIADFISKKHRVAFPVSDLLSELHSLSEESYESKSLCYGVIVGHNRSNGEHPQFPGDFLSAKRYKALSDGFSTAFLVSRNGTFRKLLSLDDADGVTQPERARWFPDWARRIALSTLRYRCAFSLTRNGDILFFDKGSLRLTYRRGRWQYWNHSHIVNFLLGLARVQRVPIPQRKQTMAAVYRQALDIAFTGTGALLVIMKSRRELHPLVRSGDAIDDQSRNAIHTSFDTFLREKRIQSGPRRVFLELASIDGAMVLANDGKLLAYGAVLEPRQTKIVRHAEGARTKVAIGSTYGGRAFAVKVSSDGDIGVYFQGNEVLKI